jgi:hypothetical protein
MLWVSTVGGEGKLKPDLSIYCLTEMCSLVVCKHIVKTKKHWEQFGWGIIVFIYFNGNKEIMFSSFSKFQSVKFY